MFSGGGVLPSGTKSSGLVDSKLCVWDENILLPHQ